MTREACNLTAFPPRRIDPGQFMTRTGNCGPSWRVEQWAQAGVRALNRSSYWSLIRRMYVLENPVLQRELLVNLRTLRAFVLLFFSQALLATLV